MAKKTTTKTTRKIASKKTAEISVDPGSRQIEVLDQTITLAEANRGNKTITKWHHAVQSAERLANPRRRELYDIYNDVLIDGHVRSVMEKRVRAVSTTPFQWEGLEDERFIDNFQSPWFAKLITQVMSTKFWGYTVLELFQGSDGLFNDSKILPRANVLPEQRIITKQPYGDKGYSYAEEPEANWIMEIGEAKDLGLLANIAPYILMKRDNLAFWATYNEVFGMPFRVYYYNSNDANARTKTIEQAKTQGAAAWVVLPENQSRVEFLKDGTSSGTSNGAYQALNETLNKEITISVLGQTLTTSSDGKGSYALGGIHKAVEEGVNLEDRLWMEYVLNYQFKPLAIKHGYPLEKIKGAFQETERMAQDKKQELWDNAIDRGLPIAKEDYYTEFGIPMPGGRPVIVRPTEVEPAAPDPAPKKKSKGRKPGTNLTAQLQQLYASAPPPRAFMHRKLSLMAGKKELDKAWEEIIKKIHAGELRAGQVDQVLFDLISANLLGALKQGYGKALDKFTPGTPDYELMLKLREDVFVFSGFKTYQELKEASKLLINEQGIIRPFAEFRELVLKVHHQYNQNYLLTEYNMAVANSQMAEKWLRIDEEKGALPYLSYRSVKDGAARHLQYNGIVRKVDDPVWDYLTPPLDWGCRCTLTQLADAEETKPNKLPEQELIKNEFSFNPGKQKTVFPKNHPYYNIDETDQDNASDLWGLKRP